jgi:hypothetical protein
MPSGWREFRPSPSLVAHRPFRTQRSAGTSQGEKIRSNGSWEGNQVYILDCKNARVEIGAYSTDLTRHGVYL